MLHRLLKYPQREVLVLLQFSDVGLVQMVHNRPFCVL